MHEWQRRLRAAGDLSLRRADGRLRVRSRTVRLVALQLATYADGPAMRDPGGNIRPGLERLAAELDLSSSAVSSAIRALLEHGWLVQTAPGHTGQRATYALSTPDYAAVDESVDNPESCGQDQSSPPGELWSGPEQSPESCGRDQPRAVVGTTPNLRSDHRSPSPPPIGAAPARAREAAVEGEGEGGPHGPDPDPGEDAGDRGEAVRVLEQLADRVERVAGVEQASTLRTDLARHTLVEPLGRRLASGWQPGELVRALTVEPLDDAENAARVIAGHRLPQLPDLGPAQRRAAARREQADALGRLYAGTDGVTRDEVVQVAEREYARDPPAARAVIDAFDAATKEQHA